MGNRAVVTFDKNPTKNSVGVYLHWNGGPESVLAFLQACDDYKVRGDDDAPYQLARFVQIIGNYFGETLSLGVDRLSELDCDNGDNGVYIATRTRDGIILRQGPDINGPWTDLDTDELRKHAYWQPDDEGGNIMTQIHEHNDARFLKSETA